MSKHTPGPWYYIKAQKRTWVKAGSTIVGTASPMILNGEQEANASLIAAAPALLEALQKIAAIKDNDFGRDFEEIDEAREIARAAIAKATGEQS